MVPPMWKLWPVMAGNPTANQTSLQRSRNQDLLIAYCWPSVASKANNGAWAGNQSLTFRWFFIAQSALDGQAESVQRISCPHGEVLVTGAQKLPYLMPEAV